MELKSVQDLPLKLAQVMEDVKEQALATFDVELAPVLGEVRH